MTFECVDCDLATQAGKAIRLDTKHRHIRPVRQGARRTTWPRAVSRLRVNMGEQSQSGRLSCPSLRKAAQWCFDTHSPSQGSKGVTGLLYAVPSLPPLHDAESVVKALDTAMAALKPESKSPVVCDHPDDLEALFSRSLTPTSPSAMLGHTPTLADPLFDLTSIPDSGRGNSPPVVPVWMESLVDVPHLPDLPVVQPSSTPLDDLLTDTPDSASLCAPLVPALTGHGSAAPPNQFKYPPNSRYQVPQKPRHRTEPHVRRVAGNRDLKARSATLPELKDLPTQRTPTCLQVGVAARKPRTTGKLAGQDSLKIRYPSGVKDENLPRSLQHGGLRTGLSPGSDAEVDCLVGGGDVLPDSVKVQLDPLEADLGNFSLDLPSSSSERTSTSSALPPTVSSPSSSKKKAKVSSDHVQNCTPNPSKTNLHPGPPSANRSLQPPTRPSPPAHLALSNATLKALAAAEEASTSPLTKKPLAGHLSPPSTALIREFSQLTHRSFFPPPKPQSQLQPEDHRAQSDGALLVARRLPLYRSRVELVNATERMQPQPQPQVRARSVGMAERKVKGRGVVFGDQDCEVWKGMGMGKG